MPRRKPAWSASGSVDCRFGLPALWFFFVLCVAPQRKGSNPSPLHSCTAAMDGDRCRTMRDHAVGCRKNIDREQTDKRQADRHRKIDEQNKEKIE